MQQASILGNLETFGVLKSSLERKPSECKEPDKEEEGVPAVIEFGAGRGYLTQMLADCYGIRRVFLVERKSYKLKVSPKTAFTEIVKFGEVPEMSVDFIAILNFGQHSNFNLFIVYVMSILFLG